MFINKKEFNELKRRVEEIERGENTITTLEYGKKSLKFYIRMLCAGMSKSKDPRKELRSYES